MKGIERRQAARMTVEGLAYVNLGPDNGGIILNISEGGLCFRSAVPVQRTEKIRLWFSHRSQSIEANIGQARSDPAQTSGVSRYIETESALAWTDDTKKRGGLRFTNLSEKAREEIHDWIRQPALVDFHEQPTPSYPSLRKLSHLNLKRSDKNIVRNASAIAGYFFRLIQSGKLRTGFGGGLVGGALASTLVLTIFLLLSHSRELGKTRSQAGERLGGKYLSQPISPSPQTSSQEPDSTSLALQPESNKVSVEPQTLAPVLIQAPLPEKLLSTAMPTASKPHGANPEAVTSAIPALSVPVVKASSTSAESSTIGSRSAPWIAVPPAGNPSAGLPRAPEMEWTNPLSARIEPSKVGTPSEKYLELGKFKDKLLSDKTTSQLSQLGFPAAAIQRNHFFGKSYQVLVGPYASDREALAAQKDLASLGFTPRSYETGKRDFLLPPALKVSGTHLPVGDCVISWESYTSNAIVKFEDVRGINVSVEGKWVKRSARYPLDAVVYVKNRDGSRNLIEIRFSGMDQALVLGSGEHSFEQ
jgi:PilZ domain/SPOR domain